MASITIQADPNSSTQNIPPVNRVSEQILNDMMESNARLKKLLESLARTYGVEVQDLPIDKKTLDEISWLAEDFKVKSKGLRDKNLKTILTSTEEPGKKYIISKNAVTFEDNNNHFEIHDAHEMAVLAKINPKFEGKALFLQGTAEQRYMLHKCCEDLEVAVNLESIADFSSIPDDVKAKIDAQHSEFKKDVALDKLEPLLEKSKASFSKLDEALDALSNASLSNFEEKHNAALEQHKEAVASLDAVNTFIAENDDIKRTELTKVTDNFDSKLKSHKQIIDDMGQHLSAVEEANTLKEPLEKSLGTLTAALRDITNDLELIESRIQNKNTKNIDVVLQSAEDKISNINSLLAPVQNALVPIAEFLKDTSLPDNLREELRLEAFDSATVLKNSSLAIFGEGAIPSLKERLSLQKMSVEFNAQWRKIEEHFNAFEKNITPKEKAVWHIKLTAPIQSIRAALGNDNTIETSKINTLKEVSQERKELLKKLTQDDFTYASEDYRDADITRIEQLMERAENISSKHKFVKTYESTGNFIQSYKNSTANFSSADQSKLASETGITEIQKRFNAINQHAAEFCKDMQAYEDLKTKVARTPVAQPIASNASSSNGGLTPQTS